MTVVGSIDANYSHACLRHPVGKRKRFASIGTHAVLKDEHRNLAVVSKSSRQRKQEAHVLLALGLGYAGRVVCKSA